MIKNKNFAMYGYKVLEKNLREIDNETYNKLKKCSKENCGDEFDKMIIDLNKIIEMNTAELMKSTKKITKKHSKKLKMLNDPKTSDTEASKIFKKYISDLAKSSKPFIKKHKKKIKKASDALDKCNKTHCKSEVVPYKKLVNNYKKKQNQKLKLMLKDLVSMRTKKTSKKTSKKKSKK